MRNQTWFNKILIVFICALFISACSGNAEESAGPITQRVADTPIVADNLKTLETIEEIATDTPTVTNTPPATNTPRPTSTKKPSKTNTPRPTSTKRATNTPEPTPEGPEITETPFSELDPSSTIRSGDEFQEEGPIERTEGAPELPAGNTVNVEAKLDENEEDSFVFLATPGSVILVNVEAQGELDLTVEVQDLKTRQPLSISRTLSDQKTTLYKIPADTGPLYRVLVSGVDGASGIYRAFFIGSAGIGFSLSPSYSIIGRLQENGTLAYTYTGEGDSTLLFNLLPHPDNDLDLIVKVYKLTDLDNALLEANESGVGEKEEFIFTLTEEGLNTYLILVKDVSGNTGKFRMMIEKDEASSNAEDDLTRREIGDWRF